MSIFLIKVNKYKLEQELGREPPGTCERIGDMDGNDDGTGDMVGVVDGFGDDSNGTADTNDAGDNRDGVGGT